MLTRWGTIDPFAEKYYQFSPYAYCAANPIRFTDPTGMFLESAWDIANLVMDGKSLWDNAKNGNVGAAIVDGVGLAYDLTAAIVPVMPGGAGSAIKAYRGVDKAVDAGKAIKATKNNYRKVLQKATGKTGRGYEAHHTLPQSKRDVFEKLGINIDEPGNVVWRGKSNHREKSYKLTQEWKTYFDNNPNATKEEIFNFRDYLEIEYFGNFIGDNPIK